MAVTGVTGNHSKQVSSNTLSAITATDEQKIQNQILASQREKFRQHQAAVVLWNQKVEENKVAAEKARIAAQNAAARQRQETQAPRATGGYAAEVEACIIQRESHGNPVIVHNHLNRNDPIRSSADPRWHDYAMRNASGLYQFMPGTWNNYGGYPYAAAAPPAVQHEKYVQAMNNGQGWTHWHYPPRSCWPL
jgi:hypothetical protein